MSRNDFKKPFHHKDRDRNRERDRDRGERGRDRHDSKRDDRREKPHAQQHKAPQGQYQPQQQAQAPKLSGPALFGVHAVTQAILNKDRRIIRLVATEGTAEALEKPLAEARAAGIKRPQVEIMEKPAFDRLLPQGTVHQGIIAVVEHLPVRDAHDLVANLGTDERACVVVLDQVTDPHNVGAILRSAAAFGCTGVIMQDRHAPELTGVLAKTASGAADVIPVAMETNLSRAIETLQEHGFFVIGLDERGTPLSELPHYDRVALVLGAEGAGLRRLVAEHCDGLASLPTQAPIYSLNVSNAAAVALYALITSA
ncbi:MAG: 23S rRNA (guanosine(2251)-2'-O)-methyltransferase RlmB [Alphaproteobacteria bacterium]|nr:23S rRNA (guanosine(2251)-2'-O)-methyltransferase RlmB [Alphaproteobacteria bacterium]